ncbi:MAG TPA: hypothetical protein VGK99_14865 [Acidobacteriota bacterium]
MGDSGFTGSVSPSSSEAGFTGCDQTLREAEQQGVKPGEKMGAATLAALRANPPDDLLKASDRQFRPITDGYVLPEDVYSLHASGKQIKD